MKKLMKKKLSLLGKEFSVLALVAIMMVGLASAALLPYFGVITGNAVVSQSVTIDGQDYLEAGITGDWDGDFVAGDSVIDCDIDGNGYNLKNNANSPVTVDLETSCLATGGNDCVGIDTAVYGVLELTKKDTTSWDPIGDKIEIIYTVVGDEFVTTGVPSGYTLIYYKDGVVGLEGRLNNPQPAIIVTSNIGSLPQNDDANINANYSEAPDYYKHTTGAKLRVVPTDAINANMTLKWSQMSDFYYETDLIVYSYADDGKMILPSGAGVNFCVENNFAINLVPDTYTITTTVEPTA